MEKMKVSYSRRTVMMLTGILFISLCVGCYRLSNFGVDAFTCMNLGISGFLHMSFGTWQLIMNAVILVVVFFTVRKNIGAGTIINMVCVGYGADFICWIVEDMLKVEAGLPLRILFLAAGCLFAGLGVAFYIVADMGIAPYDSVAFIIQKLFNEFNNLYIIGTIISSSASGFHRFNLRKFGLPKTQNMGCHSELLGNFGNGPKRCFRFVDNHIKPPLP